MVGRIQVEPISGGLWSYDARWTTGEMVKDYGGLVAAPSFEVAADIVSRVVVAEFHADALLGELWSA